MAKNKSKQYNEKLKIALYIIGIFFVFYLFLQFTSAGERKKCPYKIQGNLNADFVIKYIDSPYCIWCWFEEPILKKMVETKGDSFKLEKYDIRYCTEIVRRYGFSGAPSFVFSIENGTKEFSHMGFIGKEDFYDIICEATGDC